MVLLLLRDESLLEIPVVNRVGQVICLGPRGEPLITFDSEEVMAFTTQASTAARWASLWEKRGSTRPA